MPWIQDVWVQEAVEPWVKEAIKMEGEKEKHAELVKLHRAAVSQGDYLKKKNRSESCVP